MLAEEEEEEEEEDAFTTECTTSNKRKFLDNARGDTNKERWRLATSQVYLATGHTPVSQRVHDVLRRRQYGCTAPQIQHGIHGRS